MERKWLFHRDTDVSNWPAYTDIRRKQAIQTTRTEGSTYFFSMLHDLTQVIDAQKPAVGWEKPYLFIYTDFVHFHDDVHDWKTEFEKQKCDIDNCLAGGSGSCGTVFSGTYKFEFNTQQYCQVARRVRDRFERVELVGFDDEILGKLQCKAKLLNRETLNACGIANLYQTADKSVKSGFSPRICEDRITVKIPGDSITFEKQGCQYFEEGGKRKLYYNRDFGWIITDASSKPGFYPISSDQNADCCPENLQSFLPGFNVSPVSVPFFRYG